MDLKLLNKVCAEETQAAMWDYELQLRGSGSVEVSVIAYRRYLVSMIMTTPDLACRRGPTEEEHYVECLRELKHSVSASMAQSSNQRMLNHE